MLCTKEQFAFSAGAVMFGLPLSSRHRMFLLLRTLLIWNLIIWREVISAFKSFHSHISRVSQNIQKLLLPELQTNKRTGWIDRTWRYHTAVAFLKHKWRDDKRWCFDFDRTTCYLYQCHLSLNKRSAALCALRVPHPGHKTPGSWDKDMQRSCRPCAQLPLLTAEHL